jgi:WD40 repeat protein
MPQAETSFSQQLPRGRRRFPKAFLAFSLLWLGMILFLPTWSRWQKARDTTTSPPGRVLTAQGDVLKVVYRPDGKRLASGGGIYKGRGKWVTGEIAVWDPAAGLSLLVFAGHPEGVTGLDYSPDGKRLASAGTDGVKIWDADNGELLLTLKMQPREEPVWVLFDPQGQRLATFSSFGDLSQGQKSMAVRLWQVPSEAKGEIAAPLLSYRFRASSRHRTYWELPRLAISPDSRHLVCGQDNTVLVWDLSPDPASQRMAPARVLEGHTAPVCDQVFSPDGKRLATSAEDETIRIWDPTTGQELLSFSFPREGLLGYRGIDPLAFSPDGKRLVGGNGQDLVIWDATTGRQLHYFRWHRETIESLAFSPDGKTLASGARDAEIKLWDLETLKHWNSAGQGEK